MNHDRVGIWIDHKRAVIVSVSEGRVTSETLESDVEAHPRYSGQQDGGGEKKYEERHGQRLDRYYDEVISRLGEPDGLLIIRALYVSRKRSIACRTRASSSRTVGVFTTTGSDTSGR